MCPPLVRAANRLHLISRWMTPFWRVCAGKLPYSLMTDFLTPFAESGLPVTVQIMGTDAAALADAAQFFCTQKVAGINLNFGCPSRQVSSKGGGGGALRDLPKMEKILHAVRSAVPAEIPVSVKLRSGWQSAGEQKEILPRLREADLLFHHFRTVKEQYLPIADAEALRRRAEAAKLFPPEKIIWNGNIESVPQAEELLASLDGAGVMCARSWICDPGLLLRMEGNPAPPAEELREKLYREILKIEPDMQTGKRIELSNLIWGGRSANPYFSSLVSRTVCGKEA